VFSQNNWKWTNPSPQGNDLYTLQLQSGNELIATGDCGTIIKTTDIGVNWNVSNKVSGIAESFKYYYQYDNNIIFIGSDVGKIFKSTNGGVNFSLCGITGYSTILKIKMIDLNTGYALDMTKLYKTTNGGTNWSMIASTTYSFNSMVFFNENNGLLVGVQLEGPAILKRTSNGGINWIDTVFATSGTMRIKGIPNSSNAILYLNGKFLKTTNMGLSWTTMNPSTQVILSDMFVLDENNFFGAYNDNFYLTSNGGVSWTQKTFTEYFPSSMANKIVFSSPTSGYVMGWNNKIYYTSNAGDNWTVKTSATGEGTAATWLKDCAFTDNNTGFICGWNNTILKTTDAGNSWVSKTSPFGTHVSGICFVNANTGYTTGGNSGVGNVAKTTDGGENWYFTYTINSYSSSNKIKFFDANTGIVTAYYDQVYRTTDGGYNWVLLSPATLNSVYDICTINSNTGFISGSMSNSEKRIYKTTNAGATWNQVLGGNGNYVGFYSMKFINSSTGYCSGYGLLKTTNGGNNWFQVNAPTTSFCTTIEIVNNSIMYLSSYGVVYKSTDAGYSWGPLDIPTNERIEFAKFFDANTGIIAGDNNIILRTTNGGGNFVSNINNNEIIPLKYSLSQNYPNPFNPVTNVKFSMVNAGDVKIVVYDVQGREVQTLVNERLNAGTYEVKFDGSGLTSGVYFYKMVTDNFTETKKMLLIK
jgi:photosystem II stability/assembly factor-like uncharacterized protein